MSKIVTVVIGTRPGIVKMAPVFKAVNDHPELMARLVYTGQHYSACLKDEIWSAFGLPEPDELIEGIDKANTHATQIAKMMIGCEKAFSELNTDVVLVCGDANTNLAAGIAARKLNLQLGHVESGLRSYDWSMPEEHNRVMLDHISDYLFAPTSESAAILARENVKGEVFTTGNTVVDALNFAVESKRLIKPQYDLTEQEFVLFTTHRQENVDDESKLANLLSIVEMVSQDLTVFFPVHPRTKKMIAHFGMRDRLGNLSNVITCDPLNYLETLWSIKNARLVLTDSGGLQEESCVLGTPCVTLRENTERPESIKVGANVVAGTDPKLVLSAVMNQLKVKRSSWANPFGDGLASRRISDAISC